MFGLPYLANKGINWKPVEGVSAPTVSPFPDQAFKVNDNDLPFASFLARQKLINQNQPVQVNSSESPALSREQASSQFPTSTDISSMVKSKSPYSLVKSFEAFSPKPYYDVNGYAIGYGSHTINGRPVSPNDSITKEQADAIWSDTVRPYAMKAAEILPNAAPNQLEALTSYIYNHGVYSPRVKKLGELLHTDPNEAGKYWLSSDTSNNQKNKALTERRQKEWSIFNAR